MDITKTIRESEYTFPRQFSDQYMNEHFIINTSQDNPSSHDSNHAILIDIKNNTELLIKEIEEYFVEKNITPRFYPGWIENEIDTLFPILENNGYEIEADEIKMFTFQKTQPKVSNCTIYRAKDINKEISELIELEDGGDWNIRRINKLIINDDYHYLYIKDENQRIVTVAGLFISDKISRIDDVIITPTIEVKVMVINSFRA
jgi:hypothetical protein